MKSIIEIEQLIYYRNARFSLKIPSLTVRAGEMICVVGPNGCGKTTLLENIAGLLVPTRGRISILGYPIDPNLASTKARQGYVPDDDNWFIAELTAREYLQLLEKVYFRAGNMTNMTRRAKQIANDLKFSLFDQPLASLSHGNKRKVQIIAGLMHQPACIVIDELRNGLDPLAVIAAEHLIRAELARGAAIITSSHDLWWAERLAKTMLFLNNGEVVQMVDSNEVKASGESIEDIFLKAIGHVVTS